MVERSDAQQTSDEVSGSWCIMSKNIIHKPFRESFHLEASVLERVETTELPAF